MNVKTLVLGELSSNCYIVSDESSDEVIIIDPGDDANFIQDDILSRGLIPKGIFLTHGHFDHILAAQEISINFQIPIYVSPKDKFLVDRMEQTATHYLGGKNYLKPINTLDVKEGDTVVVGPFRIKVVEIPGHTPGSVGYVIDKNIFTGDLVFEGRQIGEYRHSYSSYKELVKSIDLLKKMNPDTIIYPGHGNPFVIADLH